MGQNEIRQALEAAVDYLKSNRADARYTDSQAVARLASADGLAVEVTGANGERVTTDMPASVGGTNSAPSPGWYLRAAEASCVATLIAMRAAQQGFQLSELEVTVDSESDDYGILGISDDVPAGPLSARVAVRVGANVNADDLRAIVEWAVAHCPVTDAVRRAVPLVVEVDVAA